MKTTTFISLCLAGALLQGCVEGTDPIESDAVESDVDEADVLREDGPGSAPASRVDAKIATLVVPGGQVVFVDEGLTEEGGGISFWELGDADLSYLLDDRNATALEVFLALTPEGTPVPERLLEHHAEVARRMAGISLEPRRIALPDLLAGVSYLTNDGLDDDGSASAKDCWGWGGPGVYEVNFGNQGFDALDFQAGFNSGYSQISGAAISDGLQEHQSNVPAVGGPTAAGHERAMAFCLSRAVSISQGEGVEDVCTTNQGRVRVFVERTTDAAYSNWVSADSILLTAFGHGGRFRSNYTNSGGGARKYRLILEWQTVIAEGGSNNLSCADKLAVAWRSKVTSGGFTGPGGLAP
jgi:hypothetical protein